MTRYELNRTIDFLLERTKTIDSKSLGMRLEYVSIDDVKHLEELTFDDVAGSTIAYGDITMDDVITLLADGLADSIAFDDVDYDANEYFRAKEELLSSGWTDEMLTIEAVQAKMLMMGYSIKLHEVESKNWHALTLQKLVDGLNMAVDERKGMTRLQALCDIFENGDLYTYEGIIQLAIFKEVAIG